MQRVWSHLCVCIVRLLFFFGYPRIARRMHGPIKQLRRLCHFACARGHVCQTELLVHIDHKHATVFTRSNKVDQLSCGVETSQTRHILRVHKRTTSFRLLPSKHAYIPRIFFCLDPSPRAERLNRQETEIRRERMRREEIYNKTFDCASFGTQLGD
jgi:glucose-6-phosphate dehydrogenase assembly protein OpcA